MIPVISVGSVKTSGTSTLALTLAAVAAAAEIPVTLIDAAPDADLYTWSRRAPVPRKISVERTCDPLAVEQLVRAARRRGEAAVIDAGDQAEMIQMGARLADKALIPVRFSPLSVYAAILTDQILGAEQMLGRKGRQRFFVASAVTAIPSRVARVVETLIAESETPRLSIGLCLRAAYEAPFAQGGTIFTLEDEAAPGLDRARAEAASLAFEIGLLGPLQAVRRPAIVDSAPAVAA